MTKAPSKPFSDTQLERYLKFVLGHCVSRFGREKTQQLVKEHLKGTRPKGGRPQREELNRLITLRVAEHNQNGAVGLRKSRKSDKIVPEIADEILRSPYLRTFSQSLGPNAGAYIDPATGEEEFDPDLELKNIKVQLNMLRPSLMQSIRRVMDRKNKIRKRHYS